MSLRQRHPGASGPDTVPDRREAGAGGAANARADLSQVGATTLAPAPTLRGTVSRALDPGAACAALTTLLLLLSLLFTFPARAQQLYPPPASAGNDLSISLLTFGPGDIYWERFGHDAILVHYGDGQDVAFNYGMFDFEQKDFMLNFARGYMNYRMAADRLRGNLYLYNREGRWVQEQKLNLTPQQRASLVEYLEWNAQPENMNYRYDYFLSNCATKVRDALDMALGGALKKQLEAVQTPYSYRYDAVRLISPDFFAGAGMDLALGPRADHPLNLWQESFVPMVLMEAVRKVKVSDAEGHEQPLVSGEQQLLAGRLPDDPKQPPDWRLPFLLGGLGLGALLLLLHWQRARFAPRLAFAVLATVLSFSFGLGGLILAAMWTLTQHWGGWQNENLLLLNPLCLLMLPGWVMSMRKSWRPGKQLIRLSWLVTALAGSSLLVRLIPGLYQANLPWIALLLLVHLQLLESVLVAAKSPAPPA